MLLLRDQGWAENRGEILHFRPHPVKLGEGWAKFLTCLTQDPIYTTDDGRGGAPHTVWEIRVRNKNDSSSCGVPTTSGGLKQYLYTTAIFFSVSPVLTEWHRPIGACLPTRCSRQWERHCCYGFLTAAFSFECTTKVFSRGTETVCSLTSEVQVRDNFSPPRKV